MTKEILHTFLVSEARQYGVESAVLLNNLRFWLLKNKANNRHNIEGFFWTYNSAAAFVELFPYMKERTISRYLKRLCELGVLKSGNFNNAKYDRTSWYTIPAEFAVIDPQANNDAIRQNGEWISQNGEWISQNGEWISQNGEPIPDINTDNKTTYKRTITDAEKKIFDWAKNHSYWRTATTSEEKFIEVLENEKGGLKKQFEQYEESLQRGLNAAGLGKSYNKTLSNNYATHQHISATDRIRNARAQRNDEQSRIIDI
jgi:hypothetical protein